MIGVWLIASVFVFVVAALVLALRSPGWFAPVVVNASMRETAQRLENRIITEAYRYRGAPREGPKGGPRQTGENWTLRITEQEATAWLSVKLPEWILNRDPAARLPASIGDLQAHFSGGRVLVGCRSDRAIVSVSGQPAVGNGVRLARVRAGIGSLALPLWIGGWAIMKEDAIKGADGAAVWGAIRGREPILKDAAIKLEDGRRIRVVAVRVGEKKDGVLEVECATEVP